jgi:hypothetical protein
MAQLSSPGVSVTVVDESFYTPAAPGTVPLIVVASAESKQNGAATGTAFGTLQENAGKVYLLTSQKDLSDTFGIPTFYTDGSNNPIHAGEQNEYGLQAAYSFLGVSNRAYVVRADLDLGQLTGTADAPGGNPADGTYWFDTTDTKFGVFEWNAATKKYTVKRPLVITDVTQLDGGTAGNPKISVGAVGDYAIVATDTLDRLYYKKGDTGNVLSAPGTWVLVGSEEWIASWPTAVSNNSTTIPAGDFRINGDLITVAAGASLQDVADAINLAEISGITAFYDSVNKLNLYSTGVPIVLTGTQTNEIGFTVTIPYVAPALAIAKHTQIPTFDTGKVPTGAVWVKTTKPNLGADWIIKKYNSASDTWVEQAVSLYANGSQALAGLDPVSGGLNLAVGTVYVKYNNSEADPKVADFTIYARKSYGATTIKSVKLDGTTFPVTGTASFSFMESKHSGANAGLYVTTEIEFPLAPAGAGKASADIQSFLDAFGGLVGSNVSASKTTNGEIVLTHATGGDIKFIDSTNNPIATLFTGATNFYISPSADYDFVASLWTESFDITASSDALVSKPADGTLWYNTMIDEIDIMVHDGETWVGYLNNATNEGTDASGPIVSATKPIARPDGNSVFVDGDLWVSTADLENFPMLYKYSGVEGKWVLVDNADQTSSDGILFADARWSIDGGVGNGATPSSIVDLLTNDFLDPDAPDPALYPRGMLLWNLRRSGFNVKQYKVGKIDTDLRNPRMDDAVMSNYYPDRWVSAAANQLDGSGSFGRKAVRGVVVAALNATVNANQQIRDEESRIFNLLACPGYPELITALVALNYDRGLTSFVVGDTPARLTPDATTLSNWGNNTAQAAINGDDGLVTTDAYLGMFYPWGYTTDLVGNNIVVPPSHMMLRTIALSDNVSYPWFAPAGTRRGGVTNVSSVGYIDPLTGEFNATALNTGQRDTLASIHVNPITYITGTGLVNYGQYTRQLTASALDRINVARLVIYLRRQFSQLAKPYVFEPNDTITRNEIKQAAESLLLELVGQRALYDYLVVCDTSNNTPARIDRSELHLDVAIEPVKAVEFIYIPLRLKNTGEIKGLGA